MLKRLEKVLLKQKKLMQLSEAILTRLHCYAQMQPKQIDHMLLNACQNSITVSYVGIKNSHSN